MSESRLIELSYFDPKSGLRLTVYADTIILNKSGSENFITAARFGGYPEMVRAMSDAIYGGASIEAVQNETKRLFKTKPKSYRRMLGHDGVYATATLMASDDALTTDAQNDADDAEESGEQQELQPRKCYIFCPSGDRDRLFEELDHKTTAPLIPEFRDYVLDTLTAKGDLRKLEVPSLPLAIPPSSSAATAGARPALPMPSLLWSPNSLFSESGALTSCTMRFNRMWLSS